MGLSAKKTDRGFTLVELLVVISIIGLLSAVVFSSVNSARAKAKNSRRIADLKQLQLALEMYYNNNGAYPVTTAAGAFFGVHSCYPSNIGAARADWIPGLTPSYISSLARDPTDTTNTVDDKCNNFSQYLYRSDDGKDFKLLDFNIAFKDCQAIVAVAPQLLDPARDGGSDKTKVDGDTQTICNAIGVWTPGAVSW
jgi:general secretion pathway protein G